MQRDFQTSCDTANHLAGRYLHPAWPDRLKSPNYPARPRERRRMQLANKPIVLVILDGCGYSETTASNAIKAAQTPVWDTLVQQSSHFIKRIGTKRRLPHGQMGNSEVGHMMLMGAGRIIAQNSTRIDEAIADGSFFENKPFVLPLTEPTPLAATYTFKAYSPMAVSTATKTRFTRWLN